MPTYSPTLSPFAAQTSPEMTATGSGSAGALLRDPLRQLSRDPSADDDTLTLGAPGPRTAVSGSRRSRDRTILQDDLADARGDYIVASPTSSTASSPRRAPTFTHASSHSTSSITSSTSSTLSPLPRSLPRYELSHRRRDSDAKEVPMGSSRRAKSEWEVLVESRRNSSVGLDSLGELGGTLDADPLASETHGPSAQRASTASSSSRFRSGSSVSSIQRTTSANSLSSKSSSIDGALSGLTLAGAPPGSRPLPTRTNSAQLPFVGMEHKLGHRRRPSNLALHSPSASLSDLASPATTATPTTASPVISLAGPPTLGFPTSVAAAPGNTNEFGRQRPALAISTGGTVGATTRSPVSASAHYPSASLPTRLRAMSSPRIRIPSRGSTAASDTLPTVALTRSSSRTDASDASDSIHTLGRTSSMRSGAESVFGDIFEPAANPAAFPPYPTLPVAPLRRPFQLMHLIQASIAGGSFITPRIFVPQQIWTQAGVKLVAIETKVRMLDLLSSGLETLALRGLSPTQAAAPRAVLPLEARAHLALLIRELDSFEGLMEGIGSTLEKKLGYAPTLGSKKSVVSCFPPHFLLILLTWTDLARFHQASFSAWSSKLSRSLDRVTNGRRWVVFFLPPLCSVLIVCHAHRSLDSPATYVDSIDKLFRQAHVIGECLLYPANPWSFVH